MDRALGEVRDSHYNSWMADHDLEIQLFFFGSAVLSGLEAMKSEAWRSRVFWGITALFLACGAFWTWIKAVSPPITGFVTAIATSPLAWFILVVIALVILSATGRANGTHTPDSGTTPSPAPVSKGELLNDIKFEIERIDSRLDMTGKHFGEVWEKIRFFLEEHEKSEAAHENISKTLQNLGEILVKVSGTATEANEAQKIGTAEFFQFRKDTNQALLSIADWATTNIGRTILSDLFEEYPYSDNADLQEITPPLDRATREARMVDARQFTNMVRNATARMSAGQKLLMRMQEAQTVAEHNVREVIENNPSQISPLDFREYYIALFIARQVAGLLKTMLHETSREERNHWSNMDDIVKARQKPIIS